MVEREYIGKPVVEKLSDKPLVANPTEKPKVIFNEDAENIVDFLPKDPGDLTIKQLEQYFNALALRCFNKENELHLAKETIANYEVIMAGQRKEISARKY